MWLWRKMKAEKKILGFVAVIFGLFSTFLVEVALVRGGWVDSVALRFLYNAIFFACPVVFFVNLMRPIFRSQVLSTRIGGRLVLGFIFVDVALFQVVAIFGLGDSPEFQGIYLKYFLLLQAINLLFLWACLCALVGQDRFHPFFKDVMRNPFGAIGYWLGYRATQVGKSGKSHDKR